MRQTVLDLLEFVGGPFDGFSEELEGADDLPQCLALPLDKQTARMFGLSGWRGSGHTAIYQLDHREGSLRYRFHSIRRTSTIRK